MKNILTIAFALFVIGASAQSISISGQVIDIEDGSGLPGATVLMINVKDSARTKFANTLPDGSFKIDNLEQAFYKMQVISMGYKTFTRVLRMTTELNLGRVPLSPDFQMLEEIQVKGDVIPVEKRGDTTLYNADAYKVNPDASAADLVKKMPGMAVSSTGVSANGEAVNQVLLDGKRFFGQDPVLALNTIPAEVVKQVEVFDQMSERSQFTGFDDGNTTKTINVVTKENRRNGQFGKLTAGYGTDDRHNVEGNINFVKDGRQLTFLGMTNDINKKSFSSSDILGVGGGGGRRGGNRFSGGGNVTPTGITQTQSIGVNFSDTWDKKGKIEGSYFFDRSLFANDQQSKRESFFGAQSQFYDESATTDTENMNHRMNLRLEYNLNENSSILFRPNISFQDNNSLQVTDGVSSLETGEVLNNTYNQYTGDNLGYNINSDLTFRQKLAKRGRTFSVNVGTQINNADRENIYKDLTVDSLFLYQNNDENVSLRTDINFTEPVGLSGQIQANYELSNFVRRTVRDGYSYNSLTLNQKIAEEGLSSHFDTDYTVHKPSISLMNRSMQSFFNAIIAYQHVGLDSKQTFPSEYNVPKQFNSVLPTLMSRVDLGKERSLFFRYSADTDIPSAQQLQEVVDNSNPLFMSVGNRTLDQSYTHSLFARYSKANAEKNSSFSNFMNVRGTQDYITNATYRVSADSALQGDITLPRGGQLTKPINLDGYWNIRDNATWGFLVSKLKTNVNASLGVGYTRIPGLANGISNISETYNTTTGLNLSSNISKNVDFNIGYDLGFNLVDNSIQMNQDNHYITHAINGKINLISKKGTVFRSDLNYQIYDGVSGEYDTKYLLWNVSIAQKFLKNKMGELSLTVFDLLNQNQSITQNVTSAYFEEVRSLVLKQYFMLSFTYTLRKFAKAG